MIVSHGKCIVLELGPPAIDRPPRHVITCTTGLTLETGKFAGSKNGLTSLRSRTDCSATESRSYMRYTLLDRGKIGLEYRLSFTVKRVPRSKLLTIPPKNGRFWPFFRIDAGAGKLLGKDGRNWRHFTGECTDFESICEIDL